MEKRSRPTTVLMYIIPILMTQAHADTPTTSPPTQETIQLKSITVYAEEPSAWQSPSGIVATRSATATKTDTLIAHTPASISVITQDQMRSQGSETVAQALRYTPGTFSESRTSYRYDSLFMRGFGGFGQTANYVQYLDGQRIPRGIGYLVNSVDPFLLERIDVVRGASSVQYGQINPGGLVNQISKRATFTAKKELELKIGNDAQRVVGLDINQPLGKGETVALRLTGLYRHSESKTHLAALRYALAPSLTWKIGKQTEFTAHAMWQNDPKGGDYNAVPAFGTLITNPAGNVNFRTFLGEASFEKFKRRTSSVGYRFSHTFNDRLSLQHNLLFTQAKSIFRNTSFRGYISGTTWGRGITIADEHLKGLNADVQLRLRLHTGAIQHTINTGLDYHYTDADRLFAYSTAITPINTAMPSSTNITLPAWQTDNHRKQQQWGIFLQNQMEIKAWLAQFGIRQDRVSSKDDIYNIQNNTLRTPSRDDNKSTYYAGLIYRANNGLSPYISYSTSFEPITTVNNFGDPFEPTTSKQWELGLKYQPKNMNALFTAAIFDLKRNQVLTKDTRSPIPQARIQTGQIQVRGLELEARSDWNNHFSTIASFTWLKPEVTKTNISAEHGKQPVGVAKITAGLWAQYALLNQALKVSSGVRYVSSSYADISNNFKVPSQTLLDFGASYHLAHIQPNLSGTTITLNIHNLTDKIHYGGCFTTADTGAATSVQCFPGSRRSIVLRLNHQW